MTDLKQALLTYEHSAKSLSDQTNLEHTVRNARIGAELIVGRINSRKSMHIHKISPNTWAVLEQHGISCYPILSNSRAVEIIADLFRTGLLAYVCNRPLAKEVN